MAAPQQSIKIGGPNLCYNVSTVNRTKVENTALWPFDSEEPECEILDDGRVSVIMSASMAKEFLEGMSNQYLQAAGSLLLEKGKSVNAKAHAKASVFLTELASRAVTEAYRQIRNFPKI